MSDNQWEKENAEGARLYESGHYIEAEQRLRAALLEVEKYGPKDSRVAVVLNNLGSLSHNQGNRDEAAACYQRALSIREEHYGPHHPWVAQSLNNLASLYRELGKYDEAETFLQRALKIAEALVGPNHYRITNCLNNLAAVYMGQERFTLVVHEHLFVTNILTSRVPPRPKSPRRRLTSRRSATTYRLRRYH